MTKILGYLVERDNRCLFIRDLEEAQWALADQEYSVTRLVAYDQSIDILMAELEEDRDLYMEICNLQEEEIQALKKRIKELQEK